MLDAFAVLCRSGPTLLLGTDAPALTITALRDAADVLRGDADAVFVPTEDGGYAVVGLQRPLAALFDGVPWGTEHVMTQTRTRLRRSKLAWRELARCWDVDRPDDFDRLRASGIIGGIDALPLAPAR